MDSIALMTDGAINPLTLTVFIWVHL